MRVAPPGHISLPPRIQTLSANALQSADPQTPAPLDVIPYASTSGPFKRDRDEEEIPETEWTDEELEVVRSTLRHPFRPLSSPYPPGELPSPTNLDEITSQIVTYGLRGSPASQIAETGWTKGWDATRRKVNTAALEESRISHGVVEKVPRAERVTRPGLRRVDSMDFLDQAEEHVGSAIRSSTSLQNKAKTRAEPADPPIPPQPRRRSSALKALRGSRPASLLQRGRSYTADELQAESTTTAVSPQFPSPVAPILQRPVRITRSQSTIIATQPPPHSARDKFLQTPIPLDPSFALDVRSASPSWSDSEDEDMKPKRARPVAKKSQMRMRGPEGLSSGSESSLHSPFEEKGSFL